jgi:nucleoid-associated protein YgaU
MFSRRSVNRARDIKTQPGVLEHVVQEGDRLDLIALHYYNDDRKWQLILDANPDIMYGGGLDLGRHVGEIILIARDVLRVT